MVLCEQVWHYRSHVCVLHIRRKLALHDLVEFVQRYAFRRFLSSTVKERTDFFIADTVIGGAVRDEAEVN